eukprot:3276642-Rhodomonas_salina.1
MSQAMHPPSTPASTTAPCEPIPLLPDESALCTGGYSSCWRAGSSEERTAQAMMANGKGDRGGATKGRQGEGEEGAYGCDDEAA